MKKREKIHEIVSDALAVGGAIIACVGIGLIYLPAGIISAGLSCIVLGWAMSGSGER